MAATRACIHCQQEKAEGEFYARRRACKDCYRARQQLPARPRPPKPTPSGISVPAAPPAPSALLSEARGIIARLLDSPPLRRELWRLLALTEPAVLAELEAEIQREKEGAARRLEQYRNAPVSEWDANRHR